MFDAKDYLIPLEKKQALVVSDSEWGIQELMGLLKTMGGETKETQLIPLRKIDPKTYIGAGKLQEFKNILEAQKLDLLLLDFDLSPSQHKNIEKIIGHLVLDRSGIILEIFNRHARTKEARLQVELARMQYVMPRLAHLWSHFERQRGSGGAALKGKGMGEKQVEIDRRLVKNRMSSIQKKLADVEQSRQLHRAHRETLLKVAIVGYTNAGKSTLLNALTHSEVYVQDALFATLDPTVRLLNPKSRPRILGIDTVGFIDRLPHDLVASFRSTLSEVLEADLLLHVLDASDVRVQEQCETTMSVLEEIGAIDLSRDEMTGELRKPLPMIFVFNKCDLIEKGAFSKIWAASLTRKYQTPPAVFISAHEREQVEEVKKVILRFFESKMETHELLIPFEDGRAMAQIHELAQIESQKHTEKGIFFRFKSSPEILAQLNLNRYKI